MNILDVLLGLIPLVMVSLAIAGVTQLIRTFFEYYAAIFVQSKMWTELILPVVPVVIGGLLGLLETLPVPDGFNTVSGRVLAGIVAGMFSGFAFRLVKAAFKQKEDEYDHNHDQKPW